MQPKVLQTDTVPEICREIVAAVDKYPDLRVPIRHLPHADDPRIHTILAECMEQGLVQVKRSFVGSDDRIVWQDFEGDRINRPSDGLGWQDRFDFWDGEPHANWQDVCAVTLVARGTSLARKLKLTGNEQRPRPWVALSADGRTVTYRGKTYPLTEDQAHVLRCLIEARGAWVPGKSMKLSPQTGERPDKIVKRLPAPIRARIESKRGVGSRLRTE